MVGKRTMRDKYLIRSEYERLTKGSYDDIGRPHDMSAWALANLRVMLVEAPDNFLLDPEKVNDDEDGVTWEENILAVFSAVLRKEVSFRPKRTSQVQEPGTRDGPNHGIPIPAEVPAAADGPAIP